VLGVSAKLRVCNLRSDDPYVDCRSGRDYGHADNNRSSDSRDDNGVEAECGPGSTLLPFFWDHRIGLLHQHTAKSASRRMVKPPFPSSHLLLPQPRLKTVFNKLCMVNMPLLSHSTRTTAERTPEGCNPPLPPLLQLKTYHLPLSLALRVFSTLSGVQSRAVGLHSSRNYSFSCL
jgi:hypothetical protein